MIKNIHQVFGDFVSNQYQFFKLLPSSLKIDSTNHAFVSLVESNTTTFNCYSLIVNKNDETIYTLSDIESLINKVKFDSPLIHHQTDRVITKIILNQQSYSFHTCSLTEWIQYAFSKLELKSSTPLTFDSIIDKTNNWINEFGQFFIYVGLVFDPPYHLNRFTDELVCDTPFFSNHLISIYQSSLKRQKLSEFHTCKTILELLTPFSDTITPFTTIDLVGFKSIKKSKTLYSEFFTNPVSLPPSEHVVIDDQKKRYQLSTHHTVLNFRSESPKSFLTIKDIIDILKTHDESLFVFADLYPLSFDTSTRSFITGNKKITDSIDLRFDQPLNDELCDLFKLPFPVVHFIPQKLQTFIELPFVISPIPFFQCKFCDKYHTLYDLSKVHTFLFCKFKKNKAALGWWDKLSALWNHDMYNVFVILKEFQELPFAHLECNSLTSELFHCPKDYTIKLGTLVHLKSSNTPDLTFNISEIKNQKIDGHYMSLELTSSLISIITVEELLYFLEQLSIIYKYSNQSYFMVVLKKNFQHFEFLPNFETRSLSIVDSKNQ